MTGVAGQPGAYSTPQDVRSAGAVIGPDPAASTDNAIVRWDGVTGRLIQDSTAILNDLGSCLITGDAATNLFWRLYANGPRIVGWEMENSVDCWRVNISAAGEFQVSDSPGTRLPIRIDGNSNIGLGGYAPNAAHRVGIQGDNVQQITLRALNDYNGTHFWRIDNSRAAAITNGAGLLVALSDDTPAIRQAWRHYAEFSNITGAGLTTKIINWGWLNGGNGIIGGFDQARLWTEYGLLIKGLAARGITPAAGYGLVWLDTTPSTPTERLMCTLNAGTDYEITMIDPTGLINGDIMTRSGSLWVRAPFLRDLSPAAATVTGDTFNSKPVYRKSIGGAAAAFANGTVIDTGVDEIVRVFGWATNLVPERAALPWEDGTNTASAIVTAGGSLQTRGIGPQFLGNPYRMTVEYTYT